MTRFLFCGGWFASKWCVLPVEVPAGMILAMLVQVVQQREVAPSFVSFGPASLCLGLVSLPFGVELRIPRDVVIFTYTCHSVLLFLFGLVASGLRILQDFAGICRVISLKFFRLSTGWPTHNP